MGDNPEPRTLNPGDKGVLSPTLIVDDGRRYRFVAAPTDLEAGWLGSVTLDSGEELLIGVRHDMPAGSWGFVRVDWPED